MKTWWAGLAVLVLAAGLLPSVAGAQSAPDPAETESTVPETEESAVSPVVEALGGVVVLDGTVTFSSGVSGASGGTGFAGFSRGGGGVGSLEVSSVDGTVFSDASQVYALAQIAGAVDVGPAVGTTDAAMLTVTASVDLSDGFWLVVGDHLLSSDGATVPVGELNSYGGLRYWLWNAPCKDWELDDTVPVSIVSFGEDPAARWADTSLAGLGLTGATLDAAFDPATLSYAATAAADSQQVTIEASAPLACGVDISPADADARAAGHQVDLGDDGAQVTVTVTAPDGSTTGQYSVQVAHHVPEDEGQERSQAELQSIVVDAVPDLDFESTQTRHEATVPAGTASTQIDAVPAEGTQTDVWAITAGDTAATPVDVDGTVTLTPGADTVVAVRASTEHNESQRIYTVRLSTPNAEPPPQLGTRSETRQLASRITDTPADTWRSNSSARSVTGGWHNDRLGGWGDHTYRSSSGNGNGNGNAAPRLSALSVDLVVPHPDARVFWRSGGTRPFDTVNFGTLEPAFAADTFEYEVTVSYDTGQVTFASEAVAGTTAIDPPDADADTVGHQVALNLPGVGRSAQTAVLITVTHGTAMETYTVTVTREAVPVIDIADIDFSGRTIAATPANKNITGAAGTSPTGLWSDGTTMWVADEFHDKVYAYDMDTGARVTSKEFDLAHYTPSDCNARARSKDPHHIGGMWGDGTTMWVSAEYLDLYWGVQCENSWVVNLVAAYSMEDATFGQRVPSKDIVAESCFGRDGASARGHVAATRGLWSDNETTMWVAQADPAVSAMGCVNAYDLATGARVASKSFTMNDFGYRGWTDNGVMGLASDGETLWVSWKLWYPYEWSTDVRAYDLATKTPLPHRSFRVVPWTSRVNDLWTDGTTVWAVTPGDRTIYSVVLP